jgi:rhodanese-related sulfurtransferase
VPSISTAQLSALIEQKPSPQVGRVLLLDVRAADEFAVSHLPAAIHVPADQVLDFAERELTLLNRSHPIVAYCSVGVRSATAAQDLQLVGFTNVKNLRGSIFQWANEGRPMQGGTQVHPYNRRWGWLLRENSRAQQSP